jgi:hypothetical protein
MRSCYLVDFPVEIFALTASIDFTGSCVRNPAPSLAGMRWAHKCENPFYAGSIQALSSPALKNEKNVRQPRANAAFQKQKIDIHPFVVKVTSAPLVISFTTIGATLSASAKVM